MTRTTIIFFFILFTMNLLGCQSNQIGTYFAQQQAKQSSPQRVGISQFNIIYYTEKYYPRGSIAGMLQSGIEDILGDDSREKLEAQQAVRREQLLAPIIQTLSNNDQLQYIHSEDNPTLTLPFDKETYSKYSQTHDLDLILKVIVALQRNPSGMFNKEGNSHLTLRQTWHFYDPTSKYLGMISVVGKSKHFDLPFGSYDTRNEQFAQQFVELTRQTSQDCLKELKQQIQEASPQAFAPHQ